MKGFDCSTPLTALTASLFAKDGFTHALRYLVPSGWKMLTKAEAQIISNAGMKIVSIFETTADRCKGGTANGIEDGKTAFMCALQVGQTLGTAIYAVADFEALPSDMAAIQAYLNGFALQIQGYEVGIYGSFSVIEAMKRTAKHFMQTLAWSGGHKSALANIYQCDCGPYSNGLTMHGVNVDLNDILGNEGGWDSNMIPVAEANKIISTIHDQYNLAVNQEQKDELHRQANYLRIQSGQPTS